MRTLFRDNLDSFARGLIELCDLVRDLLDRASAALIESHLGDAEEALTIDGRLRGLVERSEAQAIELLVLEGPVARDLRQVISSIYIVEDLNRMATLAVHIATTARSRHPRAVLPEEFRDDFISLAATSKDMVDTVRRLLTEPDPDTAAELDREDDAADETHDSVIARLSEAEGVSPQEVIDVTLIGRYYERFADHCVNVASRIIYLTTGERSEDYLRDTEDEESED